MPLSYQVLDAFTDRRFGGNPACVVEVFEDGFPSDEWMQAFAKYARDIVICECERFCVWCVFVCSILLPLTLPVLSTCESLLPTA